MKAAREFGSGLDTAPPPGTVILGSAEYVDAVLAKTQSLRGGSFFHAQPASACTPIPWSPTNRSPKTANGAPYLFRSPQFKQALISLIYGRHANSIGALFPRLFQEGVSIEIMAALGTAVGFSTCRYPQCPYSAFHY